ncbi:MAG: hypothetical protein FWC96_01870 [Oscillospiraceae bacterium]|nr:hypothetical protein [Oscillospiraceae bacterium]
MFRRKTARVILILLIGILAFTVLTGCGGDRALIGTWESEGGGGLRIRVEFFSDGTLVDYEFLNFIDDWNRAGSGTWHTDGNRLRTTRSWLPGTSYFRISGNTLTIELGGGHTEVWTRVR